MMLVKSWPFHTFLEPMALQLFFCTCILGSSDVQVHEVKAAVMDSVTIKFNYDAYRYRNLISSWCRQVSMTNCENIVDVSVANHGGHEGRVFVSHNTERTGMVNVTMVNLKHWDTGLYKWRIWTGREYNVIRNVLLQVILGLPSYLSLAISKAYDTVEMNCEYNQDQKWSKAWYKMLGDDNLQWVVHSDGNRNMDYSSRSMVFVNEEKRVLVMKMTNLEVWDSGFYQCRKSGGTTILKEILLLVTLETISYDNSVHSTLSTPKSLSTSSEMVRNKSDTKYINPVDVKVNFSDGQDSVSTGKGKNRHHKAWDILRWVVFLCMVLCVLIFSYYKKFSESISRIYFMCNRSLNKT